MSSCIYESGGVYRSIFIYVQNGHDVLYLGDHHGILVQTIQFHITHHRIAMSYQKKTRIPLEASVEVT